MSAFDIRDPRVTARLERALIFLTRNPHVSISYLNRRYELEEGSLQAWLDTFNGGKKEVSSSRISDVKAELGGVTVTKVDHVPAWPAPRVHVTVSEAAAPLVFPPLDGKLEDHLVLLKRTAPVPAAKPTPRASRRSADFQRVCEKLHADATLKEAEACRQVGLTQGTWCGFKVAHFGKGPIDRAKLAAYLGQAAGVAPSKASAAKFAAMVRQVTKEPQPVRVFSPPAEPTKPAAAARLEAMASPPAGPTIDPLTELFEASRTQLGAQLTDQLNKGLASFRFIVDVRLERGGLTS